METTKIQQEPTMQAEPQNQGELDAPERVLTLDSEGPDMTVEGKIAKYRDEIEFKSDNLRVMTSYLLGDDGQWHKFMTANYRRKQ